MSDTTAGSPPPPETNPLLKAWQTPHQTPPFSEIAPEHFMPAFERAFVDHSAEVAAITHDPAVPDFDNTITALERSGKLLTKVSAVFYDLVSAHSNPAILEIDKELSLRMARHWNPIMMNAVLFGRIAMLHEKRKEPRSTSGWLILAQASATICSPTSRSGFWSLARTTAPGCPTPSSPRPKPPPRSAAWPERRS
jgi:hypothetical protein